MSENLEFYKNWFTPELLELLDVSETEDYVIFKPKQFLVAEKFAKVAGIVREHGGEYISAGRDSHFRYAKNPQSVGNPNVRKACDLLEKALIILKEEGYT